MAINLTDHILKGEVDNSIENLTRLTLWFENSPTPIKVDLEGNCWQDIAGHTLRFANPLPFAETPWHDQPIPRIGQVGDITASMRIHKSISDDGDYDDGDDSQFQRFEIHNCLAVEWFAKKQRYFILSHTFLVSLQGSPSWYADEHTHAAQLLTNQLTMRDYVNSFIDRPVNEPEPFDDDEFAWEQRLKIADRANLAFQEVREKYQYDHDAEMKEAFAMGWDHLLDTLAEEEETETRPEEGSEFSELLDSFANEDNEFPTSESTPPQEGHNQGELTESGEIEWEVFESSQHPLQKRAMDMVIRYGTLIEKMNLDLDPQLTEPFMRPFFEISGKLAAALNGDRDDFNEGYALAILKRCSNWCQEALSALEPIRQHLPASETNAINTDLLGLRAEIQGLRDKIKKTGKL